jgi:hypothetical protein
MNNFRLIKKSTDHAQTRFQVISDQHGICGHINCPNEGVATLLRCWLGPTDSPPKSSRVNALTKAFLQARKKQVPLSQAAILRGCL